MRLNTVAVSGDSAYTDFETHDGSAEGRVSRREKLVTRLKGKPNDLTWDELVRLLGGLGYTEVASGKTGGSRRRFVHITAPTIALHKPHPGNIVKMYVIEDVLRVLTEEGLV